MKNVRVYCRAPYENLRRPCHTPGPREGKRRAREFASNATLPAALMFFVVTWCLPITKKTKNEMIDALLLMYVL